MDETSNIVEPQNRSTGALILFLLIALPMPLCLFLYHFAIWSTEQTAIATLSLKNLAQAGLVGLAAQAVVMTLIAAALWRFTKDERFKPIYAGLFGAALVAFPALVLKTLDPNNDQIGSIAQFLICGIGAGVVILLRKNKIEWNRKSLPFGLVIAGIGLTPYLVYGSFGSYDDIFFSLLASLAFGFFSKSCGR